MSFSDFGFILRCDFDQQVYVLGHTVVAGLNDGQPAYHDVARPKPVEFGAEQREIV
jgi:hypothetical protein